MISKIIVMIVVLLLMLQAMKYEYNDAYVKANNSLLWAGILLMCMMLNTIS